MIIQSPVDSELWYQVSHTRPDLTRARQKHTEDGNEQVGTGRWQRLLATTSKLTESLWTIICEFKKVKNTT